MIVRITQIQHQGWKTPLWDSHFAGASQIISFHNDKDVTCLICVRLCVNYSCAERCLRSRGRHPISSNVGRPPTANPMLRICTPCQLSQSLACSTPAATTRAAGRTRGSSHPQPMFALSALMGTFRCRHVSHVSEFDSDGVAAVMQQKSPDDKPRKKV